MRILGPPQRSIVLSGNDGRHVLSGQMAVAPRRCAAAIGGLNQFLCNGAEERRRLLCIVLALSCRIVIPFIRCRSLFGISPSPQF
jgi:hypothetical protein